MTVLALDPGPQQTAWVKWNPLENRVMACDIQPNEHVIQQLIFCSSASAIAIEMVASYGMAVGKEVFETVLWIGRFYERCPIEPRLVYRRDVKLHLCHSMRAKDANVRQAIIDRFGGQESAIGKKANPGPLRGVKSHIWSALAIALFVADTQESLRVA